MENSLLFPYRCASGPPTGQAGLEFLEERQAKSPNGLFLDPVIVVPGLGGSGLEAKLDKESVPHWLV